MDSILTSIKKMLGIDADYSPFDMDIIMHINAVFVILRQLGAGPEGGFSITGATETWSNYSSDSNLVNLVRPYMYLKVRLAFDPPQASAAVESTKEMIAELEWRISVHVDPEGSHA